MIKANSQSYSAYVSYADNCAFGKVYPLSVVQGYQAGDVFVNSISDPKTVLFWHYSGFAFISGEYDESFLNSVYGIIIEKEQANPRRFILFADERTRSFFGNKENIDIELRYFFELADGGCNYDIDLPPNCALKPIGRELLPKLNGRITPYFSWADAEDFLKKGMGYCIVCNGKPAAWAFSAAVSDNEIDIGVETQADFQHQGFAAMASKAMIKHILEQGKAPVWACHYKNTASEKLAYKLGFIKISGCFVIKRKGT